MPKAGEPTVIYRAATTAQANMLRNLLEERGIAAWVQNDAIQFAAGELPLGWRGDSQVVVRDLDADEARRLALKFEDQIRERHLRDEVLGPSQEAEAESDATFAVTDEWTDWPTCPACGEQRHTRCPLCNMAGTRFPLVDIDREGEVERVLLMCDSCDEPFRPDFYRYCHRCGHDFGRGLHVADALNQSREATNWGKVWVVTAVVVFVGLLIGAYFALVLSR
jgi:predicted RNA-binding Zn-ribbon protein involved in translation (DUF1610 family)